MVKYVFYKTMGGEFKFVRCEHKGRGRRQVLKVKDDLSYIFKTKKQKTRRADALRKIASEFPFLREGYIGGSRLIVRC